VFCTLLDQDRLIEGKKMQIRELASRTGVAEKTIRYYESVGVLPPPKRKPNGYRTYDENDVARLKLAAGARYLEFSLDDIAEIMAMRDRGEAPCKFVLEQLREKADEVERRISELQQLENELRLLYELGLTFPTNDVEGKDCICHLVSERISKRRE
jgi:MerR family transcriptional regulator, copper efflux regulator